MAAPSTPTTRLTPCHNYLLVKLTPAHDVALANGLFIPKMNAGATVHGTVESLGPDVREPIPLHSTVLVPPYGVGIRTTHNRIPYLLILDFDILGYWPAQSSQS